MDRKDLYVSGLIVALLQFLNDGMYFNTMKKVGIASFIVHEDGKILVEKRKLTKKNDPGKVVLPSGHVEGGESFEETCKRELKEELDLDCDKFKFIMKLPHRTDFEEMTIYFYLCKNWKGKPKSHEAEKIFWIGSKQLNVLDFEIDRKAIKEFFKMRVEGNVR
jgi:mutator protein MutT